MGTRLKCADGGDLSTPHEGTLARSRSLAELVRLPEL
jgi:hypothetical protein